MNTLSFCITCKNRLWQLKRTLRKNLTDNYSLKRRVEFILVDFGSTDGLGTWLRSEFTRELRAGYLKYYCTEGLPNWHASVAKNTAHLLATGDIVTNLDCDNFTGRKGARMVLNCFRIAKMPIALHQFSGHWSDGSFGRISVKKSIFLSIGGYDEAFAPMGFQDADLLLRLWKIGVTYVRIRNKRFNKAIYNTKEEGIRYCNSSEGYDSMNLRNRRLSIQRLVTSPDSVRNMKTLGVSADIFDFKGELVTPVSRTVDKNQKGMAQHGLRPPGNILSFQDTLLRAFGASEVII